MDAQVAEARARSIAEEYLSAGALDRNLCPAFPFEAARTLAQAGLAGLALPEDAGGGASTAAAVAVIKELGSVCPRSSDVAHALNFGAVRTIADHGSQHLRESVLPSILSGSTVIATAITESTAGTDVMSLATRATRAPGGWTLEGEKLYATWSCEAAAFLVFARTGSGPHDFGVFHVLRDAPGVRVREPRTFLSGDVWCALHFSATRVSDVDVLLQSEAFQRLAPRFEEERLGHAARALGTARCAFNIARIHALSRVQFGNALGSLQGIRWKFADMLLALESAGALLSRAAAAADRGPLTSGEGVAAKLAANRAAIEICGEALQIGGAAQFQGDSLLSECFRRSRGFGLNGGTLEALRNKLADVALRGGTPP